MIKFVSILLRSTFSITKNIKQHPTTINLLIDKIKSKASHAEQIQKLLAQQNNPKVNKQNMRKQLAKLGPLLQLNDKIHSLNQNIKDIQEMLNDSSLQQEEKNIYKQEEEKYKKQIDALANNSWELLIQESPFQQAEEIVMELRPGAGGSESCIFVQDIGQMYQNFCSLQGWRCAITSSTKEPGVSKGFKALDMKIVGQGAHKMLKCEAGVHKVIRVPETQTKGRLHSSTISVVVMPVVPFNFEVDPKDIKYQFTRSQGPGGQAVNKIESACRATHIPTGLAVFIQQQKSQDMNKKRATQILRQRLFELQYKRVVQDEKKRRKSQVTTMDRSQKIRTYNYPQDRITDHRIGLTKFGIGEMMSGNMVEQFINNYMQFEQEQKINALISEMFQSSGLPIPKI